MKNQDGHWVNCRRRWVERMVQCEDNNSNTSFFTSLVFALRGYQLKTHYKKSAGARTFARLMTLLESGAGGGTSDASSTGSHDHDSPKGKHSKVGRFVCSRTQPPRLFCACLLLFLSLQLVFSSNGTPFNFNFVGCFLRPRTRCQGNEL